MFAFFKNLHINLNVAIEKRESFDAVTDRETISAQDIDFFDVSIDKNSDAISKKIKVTDDSTTNFDDVKDDEMIDRDDETEKVKDETTDCSTNFDFFA